MSDKKLYVIYDEDDPVEPLMADSRQQADRDALQWAEDEANLLPAIVIAEVVPIARVKFAVEDL